MCPLELSLSRMRDQYAFVGLTEDYPLSVCLFKAMHGGACTRADCEANRHAPADQDEAALPPQKVTKLDLT